MNYHYLAQYIASTQHKVCIGLVGCGGTGTHVLTNLAAMNSAFIKLGRQPLHVFVFDPDIVEEHNIGRQMFSPADIGKNKAVILVERINRFFGFNWDAYPIKFDENMDKDSMATVNIMITCVDTAKSRREIGKYIVSNLKKKEEDRHYNRPHKLYYWMDIGNSADYGQVILGTTAKVKQPSTKSPSILPCWNEEFKGVRDKKEEPSCSLAESLQKQDLFINKIMASYATNMLWQFLKSYRIHYRGIYVNLESMQTKPILL